MSTISFNQIEKLFDGEYWDVGFLSKDTINACINYPIKSKTHPVGVDLSNKVHHRVNVTNGIILAKYGYSWDYVLYEDAAKILADAGLKNWHIIYTNYKTAAIMGGIGVRARNSLVYNYKFGFDCHYVAVMFEDDIVDIPDHLRVNTKLWSRCEGCDDCVRACPAGAIHGTTEPYWLDAAACDNFIGFGGKDRPDIPSIKSFWHKHVHPEFPKEELDQVWTAADQAKKFKDGRFPWDQNGYTYDGHNLKKDGKPIRVEFCKECISQPRCSKWNGRYPYDQELPEIPVHDIKSKFRGMIKIIAKEKSQFNVDDE
jgi:ferredoxin